MPGFNESSWNEIGFNEATTTMSLFDDTTLCQDSDLTDQESKMPDLAKRVRGANGKTAYDGKRALAKEIISKQLRKRGIHPDALTKPEQLKRAAVYKELELVYRDMADKNDSVSSDKANYYMKAFDDELDSLELDYDPSLAPDTSQTIHVVSSIPLYRS